jgi:hypothetical protein
VVRAAAVMAEKQTIMVAQELLEVQELMVLVVEEEEDLVADLPVVKADQEWL